MRRADRLFAIIQCLRRKKLARAQDLAERLEVSARTIYRDIRDLAASGVPIEGVRPLALFFYGPVWLLVAWCELRADFRSFRLDRIADLDVLADGFRPERGRTLQDYLRRDAE